ncbi:short chain dehydrogenase reductase [Trichoderma pleuroticola]
MAGQPPIFSYTKTLHNKTYEDIAPTLPNLSTAGKVVLITGASGGIGRATASSFAVSKPKALILLGRSNEEDLNNTANSIRKDHGDLVLQTHLVDLSNFERVLEVFRLVASEFGGIDILVHAAGVLPDPDLLTNAKPETFLDAYKTTVVGTLSVALAFVEVNPKPVVEPKGDEATAEKKTPVKKTITFINLTSAGVFYPPRPKMGAYVSSKMAAVKLLESFAVENEHVRLHQVHPGVIDTAMSRKLKDKVTLGYAEDDVSLPADFLVWVASSEAAFLHGKLVFAAWDVKELKERENEIFAGGQPIGDLSFGMKGFPRYVNGNALF